MREFMERWNEWMNVRRGRNEERKEQRHGMSKEGFTTNIKMIVQINKSIHQCHEDNKEVYWHYKSNKTVVTVLLMFINYYKSVNL